MFILIPVLTTQQFVTPPGIGWRGGVERSTHLINSQPWLVRIVCIVIIQIQTKFQCRLVIRTGQQRLQGEHFHPDRMKIYGECCGAECLMLEPESVQSRACIANSGAGVRPEPSWYSRCRIRRPSGAELVYLKLEPEAVRSRVFIADAGAEGHSEQSI